MRTYETMVVIHPETTEEQLTALVEKFKGVIEEDGSVISVDDMGLRKLAYPIQKQPKGFYQLFIYDGGSSLIAELERRLRIEDAVMLYQTVLHEKVEAPAVEEKQEEDAAESAE